MENTKNDPTSISYAIIRHNNSIFDYSDAASYLKEPDLNKDNIIRLLSWLIVLKIIPDSQLHSSIGLASLYTNYQKAVADYIKNSNDPLSFLPKKESRVIIADIKRSIFWFESMAKEIGLDEFFMKDTQFHVYRILSLLSLSSRKLSYIQGFDRYVLLSYLLGLIFISKSGLATDVAEAISYFISRALILMVYPGKLLENNDDTMEHFKKLDSKISVHCPKLYEKMDSNGISSMFFALRWQLLIFADEHDMKGLLYIWDNAVVNHDRYPKYVESLSVAHICQIPINIDDGNSNLVEVIQHFRNWNNEEIIKKADSLVSIPISKKRQVGLMNYLLALIIFVYIVYYLFETFKVPE